MTYQVASLLGIVKKNNQSTIYEMYSTEFCLSRRSMSFCQRIFPLLRFHRTSIHFYNTGSLPRGTRFAPVVHKHTDPGRRYHWPFAGQATAHRVWSILTEIRLRHKSRMHCLTRADRHVSINCYSCQSDCSGSNLKDTAGRIWAQSTEGSFLIGTRD